MPSQLGQDAFVLSVLGGMRSGFFVDSGASDGVTSNNTHLLEARYNWSGVCIEPNDRFFAALVQNRSCFCLNCCLYDREEEIEFVEAAGVLGGILHEYHPAHLEYAKRVFLLAETLDGRPKTVYKRARTLRSVLREIRAPRVIDYWSLDTEGSELAILKSFPYDEYTFRVLTVEHNNLPVREDIRRVLEAHGYRRIKKLGIDDCYIHGELRYHSHWRSSALAARKVRH
jgi:FkbM family methyltransferase